MKNQKGFTLVELLAVIVILAIIALIATPIILNVIDEARSGASKNSAYGYIDAVEKANIQKMYSNENINVLDGNYTISANGATVTKGSGDTAETLEVNFKGSKPEEGWLGYSKGKLTSGYIKVSGKRWTVAGSDGSLSETAASVAMPSETPTTPGA